MYKLQSIHQNNIKNKLCVKAVNYVSYKVEEKAARSVTKNKINLINVTGDKLS